MLCGPQAPARVLRPAGRRHGPCTSAAPASVHRDPGHRGTSATVARTRARRQIFRATDPRLSDRGGVYCENCDIAPLATEESQRWEHVRAWACDDDRAERLWEISEKMLADA